MSADVVMPKLSDSMDEGSILTWLKKVGDEITVGDELVEIEADKANMVYVAEESGTLIEIVAGEGMTVAVGELIARVGDAAEIASGGEPWLTDEGEPGDEPPRLDADRPVDDRPGPSPLDDASPRATPLARRIARDRGLDLAKVTGSGPGGRVVRLDVEAATGTGSAAAARPAERPLSGSPRSSEAGERASAKGEVERVNLSRLEATIARRMAESKATAPHFYLTCEVDMTLSRRARAAIKSGADPDDLVPSINDMIVKAAALALRGFPRANGSYRDSGIELYSRVNVGIAVAAQNALVVPTIFDADQKGLRQIAEEARALAERIREGTITPPELAGGTFTVSNLGMYGMAAIGPVINPPQAAILGVGEVRERPAVSGGELTSVEAMDLTLACDHRILYGAEAAGFLNRIRRILEEPVELAL